MDSTQTSAPPHRQVVKFVTVGAAAYLAEVALFNLILTLTQHLDGAGEKPLVAKTIAVAAAMSVGYAGSKHWTFRHSGGHTHRARRQMLRFVAVNAAAAAVSVATLAVSRYILGFDSLLADNVAANLIGTGLGTVLRFTAYKWWVFPPPKGAPADVGCGAGETQPPPPNL